MIIDEFQVMFTIDDKIVNKIKILIQRLAKEARSAGIHMLFTSQSMAGTLSKDIKDQFGLRVALRCSSDTSTEILGSDVASKIKAQFGYLYSNTAAGETQDSTTMWRTPFLADKYWFSTEKMEAAIAKGEEPLVRCASWISSARCVRSDMSSIARHSSTAAHSSGRLLTYRTGSVRTATSSIRTLASLSLESVHPSLPTMPR